MPSCYTAGVGLLGPLLVNAVTAPAERIRMFLQCQDEVILNMRQESQAQQRTIMAHAQLPYKNMRDCVDRLVEKEGARSLWRGYSIGAIHFITQAGMETWIQPIVFRCVASVSREGHGYIPWFMAMVVSSTIANSISLLITYPLIALHTHLATDVVRKSKKAARKPTQDKAAATTTTSTIPTVISDNQLSDAELISLPSDNETQSVGDKPTGAPAATEEQDEIVEYELAYKYKDVRDVYDTIIQSEGYLGLYKGMSPMILGTLVSHIGFMGIVEIIFLAIRRAGDAAPLTGLGTLALQFGGVAMLIATSFPLHTICLRRMIASPGRYTSSWDAAKKIYHKQGWRAFFNGIEVALLHSVAMGILNRLF